MKKVLVLVTMLIGLTFNAEAQDISKNALGLRLGDNDGFGGEISYQRGLKSNNRLELDLGLRNSNHVDATKLTGIYQWVWDIDQGFNWYVGIGAGVGSWRYDYKGFRDNGSFLFAAGDIGIEYNFDIPLQISLDLRPELYFADNRDGFDNYNSFGPDLALGLRYRF